MKSTRTKKRQGLGRDDLVPGDDFWFAMAAAFAERQRAAPPPSSTIVLSATTRVDSTSTTSVAHTAQTPATFTITTTILSTAFITLPIPVSTGAEGNGTPTSTSALLSASRRVPSSSHTTTWQPRTSTIAASGATHTSSQAPTSPVDTSASSQTNLPPSATSSGTLATGAANSTSDSMIGEEAESGHSAQKKAIVGGLSASIAGLLLIGIVVCLFLRRRRRRIESKDFGDWSSEKAMRQPTLVRKWTGGIVAAMGKGSPKPTPDRAGSMVTVMVDEEHRIIRMNTKHWARPYAPGSGEGYRESMPPGELRVVNPDPSRPASPARLLSDSTSSFMKKQRSGLSGFVFGTSRPNSGQKQQQQHSLHPLSNSQIPPTITVVNPALSRECVASYDQTPSFRSYPSVTSVAIVQQYPVDDPFLTPPKEEGKQLGHDNSATQPHNGLKRPSLATLQNARGSASRTISHLSSHLLHPFRSKSATAAVQRNRPYSNSTDSTRHSRTSDPFDLDAPSVMHPSPNPGRYGPSANGNWTFYEGT